MIEYDDPASSSVRYINRAVLSKAFLLSPLMGKGLGGGDRVKIFGDHGVHPFRIFQNLVFQKRKTR
jgi:hypothetical protein